MKREEVLKKLITILTEIQVEAGDELENIEEATIPIGGIKCFDSLRGVYATVRCLEEFDIDEGQKIVSFFEGKHNNIPCALTVGEIADKIITMISKE